MFDENLCLELRKVINETDIFIKDEVHKKKFNFICTIMDRFESIIKYLNENDCFPQNEIDFMTYLMHVAMIKDGVNYCFKILDIKKCEENGIFKEYYERDLNCVNGELNDDKFFEYFRSLSFAHPFKTDISIPNKVDEKEYQYSPYCLIDIHGLHQDENAVGVMVYSNKKEMFTITFPFEKLKEYAAWKFSLIKNIIEAFQNIIDNKENEWKKRKVNRSLNNIDILRDIKEILKERYYDYGIIEELIEYLTCDLSIRENAENVQIFRDEIIKLIPKLCDAIDNYDNDKIYNILEEVIGVRPKAYQMLHYQLEKIFCYLNKEGYGDVAFALKMADDFSHEFSKKWVKLRPYEMSFDEIKLLVKVACYLEYKEQTN